MSTSLRNTSSTNFDFVANATCYSHKWCIGLFLDALTKPLFKQLRELIKWDQWHLCSPVKCGGHRHLYVLWCGSVDPLLKQTPLFSQGLSKQASNFSQNLPEYLWWHRQWNALSPTPVWQTPFPEQSRSIGELRQSWVLTVTFSLKPSVHSCVSPSCSAIK